jgi:hypothetical protein
MMSVLEVDIGKWPEKKWLENAHISLRQTGGPCARPGTHGFDRKFPEPKADFGACRPLFRLEKYENPLESGVVCVFFGEYCMPRLAKMN